MAMWPGGGRGDGGAVWRPGRLGGCGRSGVGAGGGGGGDVGVKKRGGRKTKPSRKRDPVCEQLL